MSIAKATPISVPCDCCGRATPRQRPSQEWGFCDDCKAAGCMSTRDGNGGILRGATCPLVTAAPDVAECLQCGRPLHGSVPLTFIDNERPGLGGCHLQCVGAYHAERAGKQV